MSTDSWAPELVPAPAPVGAVDLGRQDIFYWLHTNSGTTNDGRVNLAIASRTRVAPQDLHVIEPADYDPVLGISYSRPALGITVGGVGYFTIHARATIRAKTHPNC
ncbi:hypothetical protein [Streptomyces tendae]|uniref:Uncharacterized protein n=1 Tax=Streptomyces tendae TaxID=1932 RepID=A0ABX5ZZZ7_STRTE|nr:hypothetical protein [Streptomyces tendae]QER90277.1 hypothetical protein F3L20_31670 [Streptomyces tendae]